MPESTNDLPPKAKGSPSYNEMARRYHRTFSREDGKIILEDLCQKFGFNRSSYKPGMTGKDIAFCEGLKEVLREIIYQRDYKVPAKEKEKPTKAIHESES